MSFHFMLFISFHVISCHVISCHFISCHFIHCIFLSLQASFHFSQFTKIPISFLLPDISEQVCWQGLSSRVSGMLVWSCAASHKLRGLVCLIISWQDSVVPIPVFALANCFANAMSWLVEATNGFRGECIEAQATTDHPTLPKHWINSAEKSQCRQSFMP